LKGERLMSCAEAIGIEEHNTAKAIESAAQ
jgi:hypothetical protein